jgi:hypothetical protein
MKSLKTRQPLNIGKLCKVITEHGTFKLYLSNTVTQSFTIGNICFEAIGGYASNGFKPDQPIPHSWTIDLSQPVADEAMQ